MELDDAYRLLGKKGPLKMGWYHASLYFLLLFYNCGIIGFQLMGMIFIGHVPRNYHCTPPYGFNVNETIPMVETTDSGILEIDKCHMYAMNDGIVTENATLVTGCVNGWDYETTLGETSIVTDFNLVCGNAIYARVGQSVFMAGVLAGSVTSGQLSDFFGRKVVLHVALVAKAACGIIMALVWNYYGLVVMWFLVGVFNQAIQLTSQVMIAEMFPPELRTITLPFIAVFWGVVCTLVVPLALLLPNWRHYHIFISAVSLIGVPLWWITPESVRWLISRGRYREAEEILQKIARFNRIKAPSFFLSNEIEEKAPMGDENDNKELDNLGEVASEHVEVVSPNRRSLIDAFRAPVMLRILIIMMFCWFTNSITYYALSLNSIRLSGNKYLNVFLSLMIELPSGIAMILVLIKVGRRTVLGVSFFFAGVCCVIIGCLPETSSALVVISTMGKFAVSFSFSMMFVLTPEIMPTPIRNASMGFCVLFTRLGGILAPFVIYLADVNVYLPFNLLGVSCIICALLSQVFPESRNKPLPETMEEGIERGRKTLCSMCANKYKRITTT